MSYSPPVAKFFFVLVFIALSGCAQKLNCSKLKNGKFYYYSFYARNIINIDRQDTLQIETESATGTILRSKIIWESDCDYKLYIGAMDPVQSSYKDSLISTIPFDCRVVFLSSDFYVCKVSAKTPYFDFNKRDTIYFQK